jgi:glycosyltransferase involved in cell wall biosynthesis
MQNNPTLLTVAIPFYNAEKYLSLAVQSVIEQTYTQWKLLLIDDGSTDSSLSIANRYQSIDDRIKVVSDGENKNLGYRLNQIPFLLDTEYLARMDADDIMHPEKIKKQMAVLMQHPEIDVLGTNAYTIDENNNVIGIRYSAKMNEHLISTKGFIHPTIIAKASWFRDNPYDINAIRIEDLELWYRSINSNFMMLTEPLFFYREFDGGYYKKYLAAQKSKIYMLKKYPLENYWRKYFLANKLKFILYYILNCFNMERVLINRRNEIVFKTKEKFEKYITAKSS